MNKYLLFFRFTDLLRSSRYFSPIFICLTCIMLNVGMVDNLEFWWTTFEFRGPKDVRFLLPGFSQSRVITFFRISTSLCLFSCQGQNNFISLMDIHVQHLATLCRICGDEIKDHKRKVDTNRFLPEIHQIWKDLKLLDSPDVHPPLKSNQRKKANFKCK